MPAFLLSAVTSFNIRFLSHMLKQVFFSVDFTRVNFYRQFNNWRETKFPSNFSFFMFKCVDNETEYSCRGDNEYPILLSLLWMMHNNWWKKLSKKQFFLRSREREMISLLSQSKVLQSQLRSHRLLYLLRLGTWEWDEKERRKHFWHNSLAALWIASDNQTWRDVCTYFHHWIKRLTHQLN